MTQQTTRSSPPPDDRRIIELIEEDCNAGLMLFMEHHAAAMHRMLANAWGWCPGFDEDSADEAMHDALLKLAAAPGGFDPARGTLRGYVFGAAWWRGRAIATGLLRRAEADEACRAELLVMRMMEHAWRKSAAGGNGEAGQWGAAGGDAGGNGDAAAGELRALINEAMGKVPHMQRRVLELFVMNGMERGRVAQELEITAANVTVTAKNGRERFRKEFRDIVNEKGPELAHIFFDGD